MANKKSGGNPTKKVYEFLIIILLIIVVALCVLIVVKRNNDRPQGGESTPTPEQTETVGTQEPIDTDEPTPTEGPTPTPYVEELVNFTGRIEHIFFHSLIAYPELAYNQSSKESLISTTWFKDFITVSEFHKTLDALYKDGYMLVNANDIYEANTVAGATKYELKTLKFPKGKKPLIMSFDDTNYYSDKQGFGTVDKLILNEEGKVITYTKMKDGTEIISDDNEYIQIIDKFVEKYPDFSFKGAKGMICLTGFDGILGYRTHRDSPNKATESEKVKPVIKALKETGWYFASHSYKHGNMQNYSPASMRDCAQKFKNEVVPLIGETKLYVYPYGSWKVGPTHDVLKDEFGFTYYASVGANFYIKTRDDLGNILFQDRANIDGFTLMHNGPLMVKYKDWGTDRFPSLKVEEIFSEEDRRISWSEAKELHADLYNISQR